MSTPLTEEEILVKLSQIVLMESPFTQPELTPEILNRAIEKAFSALDTYKPRILKMAEPSGDENHILLRAYDNNLDATSQNSYVEELGMDTSMLYIYSAPWNLLAIHFPSNRATKKVFTSLVVNHAGLMMANIRRSVSMNNIPFDIKGDQFYGECKDNITSIEELLMNTTRNTL